VPTQGSVAGEVDSRYALIAIERDAAPRVSECRPEIDEAIELYLLPPEADLAMQTHRRRRGIVSDEVRFRSSGPLLALNGPTGSTWRCPLIGEERKWHFGVVWSQFDPRTDIP
jgi:hypothetical protein